MTILEMQAKEQAKRLTLSFFRTAAGKVTDAMRATPLAGLGSAIVAALVEVCDELEAQTERAILAEARVAKLETVINERDARLAALEAQADRDRLALLEASVAAARRAS